MYYNMILANLIINIYIYIYIYSLGQYIIYNYIIKKLNTYCLDVSEMLQYYIID